MSDFERYALERVIGRARAVGVDVPAEILHLCGGSINHGAKLYADAHPDDTGVPAALLGCCDGVGYGGDLSDCTCWVPQYDTEQADPRPPTCPEDLEVMAKVCGDCAFRKGSPERDTPYEEEALFALADTGQPFWCHTGMRQPVRWVHPAGPVVDGDPDDWAPPIANGVPYRASGAPAYLCAGWAARNLKAAAQQ
jgi:hypothetical protein